MGHDLAVGTLARADLYERLSAVRDGRLLPFTTPGHKRRVPFADDFLAQDVPLATGIEDREFSAGFLERAERAAALVWHGDHCRFSVSGSTHGNQALALTAAGPGEPVAVSRGLHKSLLTGLILSGAEPVWLYPDIEPEIGMPLQPAPGAVEAAVRGGARAVFLVEPTYFGVMADLERMRSAAGDAALVVDQAWGSHLGFDPRLPKMALDRGADAVVLSFHKTLPAFTQSSIAVIRKERIDRVRFDRAFDDLATTSPSAAILGSIDRCRAMLQTDGRALAGDLYENVRYLRDRMHALPGVTTLDLLLDGAASCDPTKLVIMTGRAGLSGYKIEDQLWDRGIPVEMSGPDYVVPLVTVADTRPDVEVLADELEAMVVAGTHAPAAPARWLSSWMTPCETALTPRAAFFSPYDTVDAKHAVGRIAWESVVPYPPGIPAIVPGEVITASVMEGLREAQATGARLAYMADATLNTLRVVRTAA